MANININGIGGSFVTSPTSVLSNGSVPYVKPEVGRLISSSSSFGSKALNGVLSLGGSLLSGGLGALFQSANQRKQYKYQLDLMKRQDAYTRQLTADTPMLQAQGFQNAGLSRAAMQQGSFSASTIGSTPSAPQTPNDSQLPIASAVQSLLGSVLDNCIKASQAKQIDADTKRSEAEAAKADAEKVAVQDANMRENDLQPSRRGILGSQDYMQGLQSGYEGNRYMQESQMRDNLIAYQKAQVNVQETLNEYQKFINKITEATGRRKAEAEITLMLRQAAESKNRAEVYAKTAQQLGIDNKYRAEFDRLSNLLLDRRADMTRSLKNLYYYQGQMSRPGAAVNRSLGRSIEDGGLDAFVYGLGYRATSMGQALSPIVAPYVPLMGNHAGFMENPYIPTYGVPY